MKQIVLALALTTALTSPALAQSAKVPPAVTVTEGSSWSVPVDRIGPKGSTISFSYATHNGTALAGQDYTARSGSQSIRKNASRYTLSGPTIDDAIWEPDEAFQLVVTIPGQLPLVTAITIKDNDPKPPTPVTCPDGSTVIPPATCPVVTPPPTTTPGDIPAPTLAGLPPIVSYPDPSGGLVTWSYEAKTAAPDVVGAVLAS